MIPNDASTAVGSFSDEASSCRALDRALCEIDLFRSYAEVEGVIVQNRPCQTSLAVRIDRVLIPTRRLIDVGWHKGALGIECKRSGEKIGPAISQAIDYGRSVFALPDVGGVRVWLDWIFLWPFEKQHGALASIMAQNRVGTACVRYSDLRLYTGEQNVLTIHRDRRIEVGRCAHGRKAGCR